MVGEELLEELSGMSRCLVRVFRNEDGIDRLDLQREVKMQFALQDLHEVVESQDVTASMNVRRERID
jgi:hypothetical protein